MGTRTKFGGINNPNLENNHLPKAFDNTWIDRIKSKLKIIILNVLVLDLLELKHYLEKEGQISYLIFANIAL